MLLFPQILLRALALSSCAVALMACGQQGPLYLPAQAPSPRPTTLPVSGAPQVAPTQRNASTPVRNQPSSTTQPLTTQ